MNSFLASHLIVIKQISTTKFEIATVEHPDGMYSVAYTTSQEARLSEKLSDYNTANLLFDIKLMELEGQ